MKHNGEIHTKRNVSVVCAHDCDDSGEFCIFWTNEIFAMITPCCVCRLCVRWASVCYICVYVYVRICMRSSFSFFCELKCLRKFFPSFPLSLSLSLSLPSFMERSSFPFPSDCLPLNKLMDSRPRSPLNPLDHLKAESAPNRFVNPQKFGYTILLLVIDRVNFIRGKPRKTHLLIVLMRCRCMGCMYTVFVCRLSMCYSHIF